MERTSLKILLLTDREEDLAKARRLSEQLSLELVLEPNENDMEALHLQVEESGISLVGNGLSLRGDFMRMLPRLKKNQLQGEQLVHAARLKNCTHQPIAVDCTAGLGEDSLLLAAAGFEVKLFEYNPVIACLLADSLERAAAQPELSEIVERMSLVAGNSIEELPKLSCKPDVILLDPMFPARQKSALVKKKFQLLQQLEMPCTKEEELLEAALRAQPAKVIIKRPQKGPFLAGMKPSYSVEGKGIRYDCILPVVKTQVEMP